MKKEYNSQNHPNALGYCGKIASRVKECVSSGFTMRDTLDAISSYANAPRSTRSLYKIYGEDIEEARFNLRKFISGAVLKGVQEGNPKLVEFAARSKAGWNPVERVQEVDQDDADENKDAVSTLAALLGKGSDEES